MTNITGGMGMSNIAGTTSKGESVDTDNFAKFNEVYQRIVLYQGKSATVLTGDEGEQTVFTTTLPANFFTRNGESLSIAVAIRYSAGLVGLTGTIKAKVDGNVVQTNGFSPFGATDVEDQYLSATIGLILIQDLAGVDTIASLGNSGVSETFDTTVSHVLSLTYEDSNADADNNFNRQYARLINSK